MTAPFRITAPGIFTAMSADEYHGDPCPSPSLTQSIAKILLDRSPAHAKFKHPRLNPSFVRDDDRKFDIGNIAHALLLGRGKSITVVDADDWRTKAAKDAREAAAAENCLAVLAPQYHRADAMARAIREQLKAAGLLAAFDGAAAEVVLAWQEGDIWLRRMADKLSPDKCMIWDLKTTSASASPLALPVRMASDQWDLAAATSERGLDALDPDNAGRRRHIFLCQECDEPYALSISEMSEAALTIGRKKLAMAAAIWAHCMKTDEWVGYPDFVIPLEYPPHLEARWLTREIEEEERAKANGGQHENILMGG